MSKNLPERRAHPRHPIQAKLVFEWEGQEFRGTCQDLSEGGLCFMSGADLALGTKLTLFLFLSKKSTTAKLKVGGVIQWQLPLTKLGLFRYGVDFVDVSAEVHQWLTDFLQWEKTRPHSVEIVDYHG